MKQLTIAFMIILVILATLPLLSCTQPASPSSYPPPANNYAEVNNFIEGIKTRYTEGLICGGTNYASEIGISSSDLLSLKVQDDNIISLNEKPYYYATVSNDPVSTYPDVTIGDYYIKFSNATPGVTSTGGGRSIRVQADKKKKSIGEFIYHEVTFIIINDSVNIKEYTIDELVFLFMYYKPDCESNDRLWLVLMPVPDPVAQPGVSYNISHQTVMSPATDELILEITSLTSPINSGMNATLTAQSEPGAQCYIVIDYGPSGKSILHSQTADSSGNMSWTWTVGNFSGIFQVTVTAKYGGHNVARMAELTVRSKV